MHNSSKKNKPRYDYNIPSNLHPLLEDNNAPSDDPFYTPHNDHQLIIQTKPEIRKGCIWEIQLKLSQKLLSEHDIKKIYILTKKKNVKLDSKLFYVDLKIRSKLIRPIKEMPFGKVGAAVNEADAVDVNNGVATLRVKFNLRPRTVFHKHADMMILVATLMHGEKGISSTAQELIFRGGTGSVHSADSRKKAILNSKSANNDEETEKNKKIQGYQENMVVDNNQGINNEESKNIHNYVPVTEYEDFNANVFWNDFYHNKGERLIPNNNQTQTNQNNDEMIEETMNFMNPIETELNPTLDEGNFSNGNINEFNQNCQFTTENFSICLNGVKSNQSGGYQAAIQGNFFNKPLTGTVMLFFDQNEGTFKGTFSGSLNN
jgi:hypothetical protein